MRRRSTGSAAESDGDGPASIADPTPLVDGIGGTETPFTDNANPTQSLSTQHASRELDRRESIEASDKSRRPSHSNWKPAEARNGSLEKDGALRSPLINAASKDTPDKMSETRRRSRLRSPWSCSPLTLVTTALATLFMIIIVHSFVTRQLDSKGCRMSYMRPSFAKLSDFDTEHTRFASKYSVYLYREGMVDEDTKVGTSSRRCVDDADGHR
jgi:glycosylphosphatidylinositol deacylase